MPRNIYLFHSDGFDSSMYEAIVQLFKDFKYQTPLKFLKPENPVIQITEPEINRELFDNYCQKIRSENKIPPDDFIVLLSDKPNQNNWFSFFNFYNHVYVQCSGWDEYTKSNNKYPIAHQIVVNVVQSLMKLDYTDRSQYHIETTGCINDLCPDKKSIVIKMLTGHICNDCEHRFDQKLNVEYWNQIVDIFSTLSIQFKSRTKLKKLELLEIGFDEKHLIINEKTENYKIRFEAKQLAFLLLYIKYSKKGISTIQLPKYEEEWCSIYNYIKGKNKEDKGYLKSIPNIDKKAEEFRSRINKKLKAYPSGIINHLGIKSVGNSFTVCESQACDLLPPFF